jgi:hypothetical protein
LGLRSYSAACAGSPWAPAQSERTMSATLFLAFCILGCDFLLYVLFQWTYGERRRGLSRRSKAPKTAINQPDPRPFLVAARRSAMGGVERLESVDKRIAREENSGPGPRRDVPAYRSVAASFAQAKR